MIKVPGCPLETQNEEVILKNTFGNAQMGPVAQYGALGSLQMRQMLENRTFTLKWTDEASSNKIPLAREAGE